MKYLIYIPGSEPFFTNVFDAENNFVDGMVVINMTTLEFTTDCINWHPVQIDKP